MGEFCGSWKFVSCENFDDFLKEMGINVVLRKMAAIASPTVTFEKILKDNKEIWTMRTETFVRTVKVHFELNEPFSETTIDLRKVESLFLIEEDPDNAKNKPKFVQIQTDKEGRRAKIERQLDDEGKVMNVTMTLNGVISTAIFKKTD